MADNADQQASPSSGNPLVALQHALAPVTGQSDEQPPAPNAPPEPEPYRPEDDVIWIEKARQIIKRSKGDPYTRQDALSQLKTQYLKQRFGKTIGGEDVPKP